MPPAMRGETFTRRMERPRHNNPESEEYSIYTGRESLRTTITNLYGEEVHHQIRRFENLRKKRARLLCSLTFLSRCRDQDQMPNYLRLRHNIQSPAARRIYDRASKALLREQIHDTRRELDRTTRELYQLHLSLSATLETDLWRRVDIMTTQSAEHEHANVTERQCRKYDRLESERPARQRPKLDNEKLVINRSDTPLTAPAISVLAKGGNFAVAPRAIPTEEIIANVEGSLRNLPPSSSEEARHEVCRILRRAPMPKSNISGAERKALKELRSNKDIIILPADKGNATVILNTKDYEDKLKSLLTPDIYTLTARNPTATVERKTIQLLKNTTWEAPLVKKLQPSDSRPPRLYGLPKIHKPNVPLRPIVSTIGSPTYALAKHLTTLMRPHEGNSAHQVKNSGHFIDILKTMELKNTDIMVSFDVESLFTKVPVRDTLVLLNPLFPPEEIALFEHCLTSSYFLWNGSYYLQSDGVAMGNPLSPVMANFFMRTFEEEALAAATLKPSHWYRYVDDTFVIWPHGRSTLDEFLAHLNNCHPNIRFTMEVEENNQLPFLDVLVSRDNADRLSHRVYRKPTHTDRYLHADSNHHPAQKRTVIKTLVHRAKTISDPEHLEGELKHLTRTLMANGYNRRDIERAINPRRNQVRAEAEDAEQTVACLPYIRNVTDRIAKVLRGKGIKTIFQPTKKLQDEMRSAKDQLDPLVTPGIYRIPCECGKDYIGMTQRTIATRRKEHERALRLRQMDRSAVAQHALEEGHQIHFSDIAVLARTTGFYNLGRREALELAQHPNNYNRDEVLHVSKAWRPALRNKQLARRPIRALDAPQSEAVGNNQGRAPIGVASNDTSPAHRPQEDIRRVTRSQTAQLRATSSTSIT